MPSIQFRCPRCPSRGVSLPHLSWHPHHLDRGRRTPTRIRPCTGTHSQPCLHKPTHHPSPRWLLSPAAMKETKPSTGEHCFSASIVWDFFDPAGSATEFILKSRIHMYGKYVRCKKFVSRPPFSQCDRCLQHGHTMASCKCPASFVICFKCGGPHSSTVHKHECIYANFKHKGLACICPPSCFLCRVKGKKGSDIGHYATSAECPLRKQFHSPSVTASNPEEYCVV